MTGPPPNGKPRRPELLGAGLWPALRRLILFVLGVVVIVDALVDKQQLVGQLVVGTLLVGVVPVDELLDRIARRKD